MDLWYFYCTLCILKNDIKCHYTIITVMTSKHLIIFFGGTRKGFSEVKETFLLPKKINY